MAVESRETSRDAHSSRPQTAKTQYLVLYNAINASLWLVVLVRTLHIIVRHGSTYDTVGDFTKWTQTIATMEIIHAALGEILHVTGLIHHMANSKPGIVRAPVVTTFLQVWSRLFVVWGIVDMYPHVARSPAYSSMLVAYGCTEVIRYSYFALSLSGYVPEILNWLRYNAFIVLYPLGISSEYWQMLKAYRSSQKLAWQYQVPVLFHLIVWPPCESIKSPSIY